jgi:Dual specificity phosphatase, catalytic domain
MKPPLENSYWVVQGRVLGGEHPSGENAAETQDRLHRLREAGINYFIDLTEPGESQDYRALLPKETHYLRCPIADTTVPEDFAQMHEIQLRLRNALTLGRRIYVHCRAGIGRTGLVVGCYLAEGGLDGAAALKKLNELWQQSERAKSWPVVPQTDEQADYIRSWAMRRKIATGGATRPRPRPR